MKQQEIICALLKKYEKSSHLLEPGKSNRRVMLNIDKAGNKDFPQYAFENTAVRDAYNAAAKALAEQGLISIEWLNQLPRMQRLILNLERVEAAYALLGRMHPRLKAEQFSQQLQAALQFVQVNWIKRWQEAVVERALATYRLPDKWEEYGELLLKALQEYARLQGAAVTMRALSVKCFHDSKRFERELKDRFLHIAASYDEQLHILLQDADKEHISWREQLAYLGIYARPELYELSGRVCFSFAGGQLNLAAVYPHGLALPATVADSFTALDLTAIKRIIFIENKTNYDEFLQTEMQPTDFVIYHGGMLSVGKKKFFARLAAASSCEVLLWSDIDLGGMEMFTQLAEAIPRLQPWRMDAAAVAEHRAQGLQRSEEYWQRVQQALASNKYPQFTSVLGLLLKYRVTIEQESFLLTQKQES